MTSITIEAGNEGKGTFTRALQAIARAAAIAGMLATMAVTAQAADSADRISPPNPNDVAILRGLLALQNPALRQAGSSIPTPAASPALTTEPEGEKSGQAAPATEGEACIAPGMPTCGVDAESRSAGDSFRASLSGAMASAQ